MSKIIQINSINDNSNNLIKGKNVEARYIKPELSEYENNPLIEALPRILTTDESIERLAHFPAFDESMRKLPDHLRFHKLEAGLRFFSPLDVHLDLERRISCLLRSGYIERNPLKHEFYKKIDKAFDSFSQYGDEDDFSSTRYYGFNVVGISGIGKSQTIQRILSLYPQVIRHSNYQGKNFTSSQLVWLKLDCPYDGSTKGLCLNFFQAIDRIFGTNYLKNYGTKRTTDEMLPYLALVAANHFLGVWIIDEIQRLNLASSGGAEKMLNFFTQLVNIIGVPVIMVGTYKALPLFNTDFSQMRRGTGQGDLIWDRMSFDEEWQNFVESLWDYQYTRSEAVLGNKDDLSLVLYEETQGITDLAVKTFIFAQQRAIESGKEKITASIIRSVAKDKFKMLQHALKAMKSKDKRSLEYYEDLYPVFKDSALRTTTISGELANAPEIQARINNEASGVKEVDTNATDASKTSAQSEGKIISFKQNKNSRSNSDKPKLADEKSLVNLFRQTQKENQSFYQVLLDMNYIRQGNEFLEGGLH
ncbi:MAG: ATP-binding protein [Pyrinomonadaceae bacterium]|nr:ATP-binding protein [Pyrinomonadaceae bacterium]